MKLTKRFFRRSGDDASARDSHTQVALSDGTKLYVNVELVYYPKATQKISWYVSIASLDLKGKHAGAWHCCADNRFVMPFIAKALSERNKLAFLPHRQRQNILENLLKNP